MADSIGLEDSRPSVTNKILYGRRKPIDLGKCKPGSRDYARGVMQNWFLTHLDHPYIKKDELLKCASKAEVPVECISRILVSMRKRVRERFRKEYPMWVMIVGCKEHCPCCPHYKNYVINALQSHVQKVRKNPGNKYLKKLKTPNTIVKCIN